MRNRRLSVRIKRLVAGVVLVILLGGFTLFFLMSQQISRLGKMGFGQVDIAAVPDGIYQGSASATLVQAQVEVFVQQGHIQDIKLLAHRHGPGHGAESLVASMIQANSLDVDSISGATASSLVVKAAVLEALKNEGTP